MRILIVTLFLGMAHSQALIGQLSSITPTEVATHDSIQVKVLRYHLIGRTAPGQLTRKIKEPFIAISRDLLDIYPLGSYLRLSNCAWSGTYRVMDKMGKRHIKTIDVFSRKKKKGITYCTCQPVKSS